MRDHFAVHPTCLPNPIAPNALNQGSPRVFHARPLYGFSDEIFIHRVEINGIASDVLFLAEWHDDKAFQFRQRCHGTACLSGQFGEDR